MRNGVLPAKKTTAAKRQRQKGNQESINKELRAFVPSWPIIHQPRCPTHSGEDRTNDWYLFLTNRSMEISVELARLSEKLKELKVAHNRLFANHVELEINRQLIIERYDELHKRSQYLSALAKFLLEEQPGESPPVKTVA